MQIFGSSDALYNAEGLKTQVWGSVVKGAVLAMLPGFFFAPQQAYSDVQPVFSPTPIAKSTQVPARLQAQFYIGEQAYQNVQPLVIAPIVKGVHPASGYPFIVGEQAYQNVAPYIAGNPRFTLARPLGTFFSVPQQTYSDIAPVSISAQPGISGAMIASSMTFGGHARALYDAEAQKSAIFQPAAKHVAPLVTGILGTSFFSAPEQRDLSAAANIFPPAPTIPPPAPGLVFSWTGATPDPTEYPMLQPAIYMGAPKHLTQSQVSGAFTWVPAQFDHNIQPAFFPASPTPLAKGVLGTFFVSAPQAFDHTLPAVIAQALRSPPIHGPPTAPFFSVPEQAYEVLQPRCTPVSMSGTITCPNVVGWYWGDAYVELINLGLNVTFQKSFLEGPYVAGIILAQHPGPTARITEGTTVILTVNAGSSTFPVP